MRAPQIFALIAFIIGLTSIVVKSVEKTYQLKAATKSEQRQ